MWVVFWAIPGSISAVSMKAGDREQLYQSYTQGVVKVSVVLGCHNGPVFV